MFLQSRRFILGLYYVFGISCYSTPSMITPAPLVNRQTEELSSDQVLCGLNGLVPRNQCCDQEQGWACQMSDGYCGIDITPYSTILGCFTGPGRRVPAIGQGCSSWMSDSRRYIRTSSSTMKYFSCVDKNFTRCSLFVQSGYTSWFTCETSASITSTFETVIIITITPTDDPFTVTWTITSTNSAGTFSSTTDSPELSNLPTSGSIIMDTKPIDAYRVLGVGIIVGPCIGGLIILGIIITPAFFLRQKGLRRGLLLANPGALEPPIEPQVQPCIEIQGNEQTIIYHELEGGNQVSLPIPSKGSAIVVD